MAFDQLKAIIVDQLDTAPEDVSLASSFTDDPAPTPRHGELIMAIEEKMESHRAEGSKEPDYRRGCAGVRGGTEGLRIAR